MKKEIFIHVGPPKTGTSAIQKWLNEHNKVLQKQGLYYPAHTTDKNGVSSGNLLSIFSRKNDNSLYVDTDKVSTLLNTFYSNKKYSKLLLSSEFFFLRMSEIRTAIPDALFIGYLRNPIEKRESQYNQGVKRASFIHKYPNKIHKNAQDFSVLTKYIKEFSNNKLVLRPYGDVFFIENNIVNDLLYTIGLQQTKAILPHINNSYNFEALELKRWLNRFPLENLAPKIDIYLQSFNKGIINYTLIEPEVLDRQIKIDVKIIKSFFELTNTKFSNEFIDNILKSETKKYYHQDFEAQNLIQVMEYLNSKLGSERELLLKILERHEEKNSAYTIIFTKILKKRTKYQQIKNKFSTNLKKLKFF